MATVYAPQAARAPNRKRVLMNGTLFTPEGACKVLLRDISRTGAQVCTETPIASECDAVFKRGSVFAAARIAWSSPREAGLRFYRELTTDELDSMFHPLVRIGR
jgi:hypothetical protein